MDDNSSVPHDGRIITLLSTTLLRASNIIPFPNFASVALALSCFPYLDIGATSNAPISLSLSLSLSWRFATCCCPIMAPTRRAVKAEPDSPAKTRAAAVTAADNDIANPQPQETAVVKREEKQVREAVPELARFPLAVALSFALASLGYSLVNELGNRELGALNRTPDTWAEVGLLSGWRL
jgi:hypothetical protein